MSNVDAIRRIYEAIAEGDAGPMLERFAPDVVWYSAEGNPSAPDGTPFVGGEAIMRDLFGGLGELWDGFLCTPNTIHDAGDTVVVEARYTAVSRATGQALDAQACHVWTMPGGRIERFQQYVDTAQLQDVLGLREATRT